MDQLHKKYMMFNYTYNYRGRIMQNWTTYKKNDLWIEMSAYPVPYTFLDSNMI